jgi:tRNA(Arg) A34 adenosine deaminase TadA
MRLAVEQAMLGEQTPGCGEVGCVIVQDGEVLVASHNEAELLSDPTAHAEIIALGKLGQQQIRSSREGLSHIGTEATCEIAPRSSLVNY